MRNILLFLPLLIFFSQEGISQSRDNTEFLPAKSLSNSSYTKLFLGVKIGPAIPIGEFGTIDLNEDEAGLAKTGIQLNANLQYLFTESFYGIVEFGYSSNPFDEDELLLPLQPIPTGLRVSVTTSSWNGKTVNIGVGTRTAMDAKTYFLTKFALGLQSMESPSFTISITNGTDNQVIQQTRANSSNLNLNLGAAIVTEINEKTFFNIGLDYIRSDHDFSNIIGTNRVNGVNASPPIIDGYSQNVEIISITVGLNFKI